MSLQFPFATVARTADHGFYPVLQLSKTKVVACSQPPHLSTVHPSGCLGGLPAFIQPDKSTFRESGQVGDGKRARVLLQRGATHAGRLLASQVHAWGGGCSRGSKLHTSLLQPYLNERLCTLSKFLGRWRRMSCGLDPLDRMSSRSALAGRGMGGMTRQKQKCVARNPHKHTNAFTSHLADTCIGKAASGGLLHCPCHLSAEPLGLGSPAGATK